MVVAMLQQSPSLFQSNQGVPSAATNTLGSIAPPWASGHTNADDESSVKGPAGFALVARETHIALDSPWVVLTHPDGGDLARHPSGIVAGVE
jgi:hypothetical protein